MVSRLHVVNDDDSSLTDLADAARAGAAVSSAQALAEWIGAGRALTASGVLKPAAAAEVCDLLGIELPSEKPRSALDIDELMMVWSTAASAGFIEVVGKQVMAGAGLDRWLDGDPETTLVIWTHCVLDSLGLAGAPDDEPELEYLAVLCTLYDREGTTSLDELATSIEAFSGGGSTQDGRCPDCGQVHAATADPLGFSDLFGDDGDGSEFAEEVLLALVEFGVADFDGHAASLTPLGKRLTTFMFRDSAPAADADTATFVSELAGLPPVVAALMARPWLDARTPAAAAGQLLAFAESADGTARMAALAFARECGPEAAPAWQEWSGKPGFGVYARAWLAEQGDDSEFSESELSDGDEAWMVVDTLASILDALPVELPDVLLSGMLQAQLADEIAEVLPLLASSDHPAAGRLVRLLSGTASSPLAGLASHPAATSKKPVPRAGQGKLAGSDSVHQIKITLRGVWKPPVWRRVLVPAGIRLDELHEVILRAFGWGGHHLRVFSDGWTEYGVPDRELGHQDESSVRLSQLLLDTGAKIRYTYDFGDDWEHDIQLEKILPPDAGTLYPACTAGKGACPPDGCGGVWGYSSLKETLADPHDEEHQEMLEWLSLESAQDFDPAGFSVEEVNIRLGRLNPQRPR
ncbi:MAG: PRiA4b ORF-3-like protein [Actinomycetia bacterium]|nr:PRiA4b ORF-3-like protein [Actinomycetes bacterium]